MEKRCTVQFKQDTNLKKNAQCDRSAEPCTALCSVIQNIVAEFYRFSFRDIRAPAQFGGFAISCSPVTTDGDKPQRVRRRDDAHGFLLRIPSPKIGVPRRWKRATVNRPPFRFPEFTATSEREKRGNGIATEMSLFFKDHF